MVKDFTPDLRVIDRTLDPETGKRYIVNTVIYHDEISQIPPFGTTNEMKQREITGILGSYDIQPSFILNTPDVPEIQGTPDEVIRHKAISFFNQTGHPVIVEDTSIEVPTAPILDPGNVKFWASDPTKREQLTKLYGNSKAVARTKLAFFDGQKVQIFTGEVTGTIASELKNIQDGGNWDDMFIPDDQNPDKLTFSQMNQDQKNLISMRRRALDKMFGENPNTDIFRNLRNPVFVIDEPFLNELARIRPDEIVHPDLLNFAYSLDEFMPPLDEYIDMTTYHDENSQYPVHVLSYKIKGKLADAVAFARFTITPYSARLGATINAEMLHDVEINGLRRPQIYQYGPDRKRIAIAQRALYFRENHNEVVYDQIREIESSDMPERANRQYKAVKKLIGNRNTASGTSELGYNKHSTDQDVSRKPENNQHMLHKIGKQARKIVGGGSMPSSMGSPDMLSTLALGHQLGFIPRNSIYDNLDTRLKLAQETFAKIDHQNIPDDMKERARRNVGASIGVKKEDNMENLEDEVKALYDAGIRTFRIYTISGETQKMTATAKMLRQKFGDDIEIFAGQIVDEEESAALVPQEESYEELQKEMENWIGDEIRVDGIIIGNGGGRQCTSATNGMAVTTLEIINDIIKSKKYNKTSLILEGGVGQNLGTYIALGVDCVLYNNRIAHGALESPSGSLFFYHPGLKKYVQPYPGEASFSTQIQEAAINNRLLETHFDEAGRAKNVEGKRGWMILMNSVGGSMAGHLKNIYTDAAKCFADLGVRSVAELRALLKENPKFDPFRKVTPEANSYGQAYLLSK